MTDKLVCSRCGWWAIPNQLYCTGYCGLWFGRKYKTFPHGPWSVANRIISKKAYDAARARRKQVFSLFKLKKRLHRFWEWLHWQFCCCNQLQPGNFYNRYFRKRMLLDRFKKWE